MLKYLDPDDLPVGWKDLCVSLDSDIQQLVEEGTVKNFAVLQLKEKYGEMRLYFFADKGAEQLHQLIDDYGHISFWTCAKCGAFPATKCSGGWILPFCERCAPKDARTLPAFEPIRTVSIWSPGKEKRSESYDTSYVVARIAQMRT